MADPIHSAVDAIREQSPSIYDPPVTMDSPLYLTNDGLQQVLVRSVLGQSLAGLPLRTRSKVAKALVCEALGFEAPPTFRKTQPRFPHPNFDLYVQKANNLQIWNEEVDPERRYVVLGLNAHVPLPSLDEAVGDVVDRVTQRLSLPVDAAPDLGEPEWLLRADGTSVYTVHGSRTYTSAAILDAERRLLEAAERTDGHLIPEILVDLTVRRDAADGMGLDSGQAELVKALATSGSRIQVALAPAGSGKTTAMAALAKVWRRGGGHVIGLAPTAVAADELGQAIDMPAETIAKFLHSAAAAATDGRVAAFPPIGPRTLVVIDEAGMVGTKDLAAVVDRVLQRGGQRPPGRGRPAADCCRCEWCFPRPGRTGRCAGDDGPPHRTPPLLRRGGGCRDTRHPEWRHSGAGALSLARPGPRRGSWRCRRPGIQRLEV